MFLDTMFFLLVLCRVLSIAGVQTLTIDSQLGTSIEDCFERISIGEQLPPTAIYRNVSELTSRECEHICKQDKQCQVYDYGVGAKGNATCNLSMLDEKEVKEKNLLSRHPDYDVYVRRVLCEQTPPKPIQVLQDDPGPPGPNTGPQHRPVFRPDPEDRPLNEDYLISSNIGYKKPQNPYRPDDPSNTGIEHDFPPSYGLHKPQNIPYKPTRPNDKFGRPQKPIDQNDQLHFQGYGLHRPDPLNDYHAYKPDRPNYLNRPNRRPQDDYHRPDGPIGPPDRPSRPNRPYKPAYDYNNQHASNYGQNNQYATNYGQNNQYASNYGQTPNDVYVEIYDPPRPYVPIKDRPHQDYSQGYLGYGTYSSQNSYTGTITEICQNDKFIYCRPQKPDYGQINTDQGYQKPQKPSDFNSNYGSNQDYNRPDDYGGYGYQKPSYNKPSNQDNYDYYDQSQSGYGTKPSEGYRPQKPSRPHGVNQDGYGSQGSYGSGQNGYGGGQNGYGSNQGSYGSYDYYNQGGYGSYGSSQYPYGQNYGSSYGYQNDYDYNRPGYVKPGYGNDDPYNKPYQKPKPEFDYQKPGYNLPKPESDYQKPQKPGYGDQNLSYDDKPGYGVTKPTYDDKPGYNNQTTGYGGQKPGYNDQTTGYGNQKPGYSDQTASYGNQKPGYNDQTTGYGNQKPEYGAHTPDYGYQKPGYNDHTAGYGNQKPGYSEQTTGYGNQKPGYSDETSGYGGQKPAYNDLSTGYGDQTGYNANKPAYSAPTTGYGNQKPDKPGYNQKPQKPGYMSSYNDGYQSQKPVVNYSDPNRPDVRPVYEFDLDKPGNVPSYIVRPGGEIVTSHPVLIGDYGKHPVYKEPARISYKACFRRVLAGRRALRSFVRKVYDCDTLEDCRRECATEKRFHCESFNYRHNPSYQSKGLCELMTQPIESFDLRRDFVEDKNYDFYEVDRNSLEPNCQETLRGPGMLHSGFLSSKPPRAGGPGEPGGGGGGWKDRNWSGGGSYFDQMNQPGMGGHDYRNQNRRYEAFIPYQIGMISRSDDQDKWGQYGGLYGGNQDYYKDRNDYHKSITHWGLTTIEPPSTKYLRDFDYNTLGRHFESSIGPTVADFDTPGPTFSKPPPTDFDAPRTTYAKTDPDAFIKSFPGGGKTRYGYGSWKRGWWNSSGLNDLEHDGPKILEAIDRNDVEEKECFARRRPGMSLGSGAIRRSLLVRNVVECEGACFSELEFKCVSYSYRYSNSHTSDNCFLSERPYRGLELSADSGSDVYAMSQQCGSSKPYVESECFWHVRSDSAVSGAAVKATLTVAGLGACEAECIRASGFFCRGFSFRFESPTIGDEDLHNCILTSFPPTKLDGNSRVSSGHELYSRGNYGRGCEPATYDDIRENGECYLQYDKAAKLTPSAVHAHLRTKSEEACANACSEAPFKCLSFSYNNNAPPDTDNCYLSEIRLFDLQKDTDYVHSTDDWLFAFDVFNSRCFRGRNDDTSAELPHPIHASSEEDTFPGTAPSGPTGFSDPPEPPHISPSGPPSGPTGPSGVTHEATSPERPYSHETTGTFQPTRPPHYSTRPYPGKDDHSPELPRPIQNYRPRPNRPQIDTNYGPPELRPSYRPPEPDVERPFRPGYSPGLGYRPLEPKPEFKPPGYPEPPGFRPPDSGYGPGSKPGFEDRPGYLPGIKPGFDDRPGYGPGFKPGFEERPGYGSGFKPGFEDRPGYGPGFKPGFGDRPGYLPEGPRPQKPVYHGDREDPSQESWSQYTVSGFPCRAGTTCAQNQVAGHWACEPEGGEIGSWDYCCAPTHRCGYSEGFHKPWCYVGSKEDQWRPCSDKYYPYHQHNVPHPSQAQGSPGKREDQRPNRPWRETYNPPPTSYIPHWDKRPGPYLSEADKRYWDELYDNGPKSYYDRFGNPLPGYSRVPTEGRPHINYRPHRPPNRPATGHWIPVSYGKEPVPGLGAPRYWPVAYLHRSPPPNITYFRYNESYTTTTERHHTPKDRAEARNIDDLPESPEDPPEVPDVPDSKTERTNNKPNIFEKPRRDENKFNKTSNENTIKVINKTVPTTTSKEITTSTEEFEDEKTEDYKELEPIKGIDDKLDDFSKSLEVLNIEDAKKDKSEELKTLEAEEKQIEAIGRLLASRRGSKIILEKRSHKDLETKSISVDKDALDFDFGNKFPTENPKRPDSKSERRGTIKRITKEEIEKDRNADRSLEVSETTFVRPPRVLSTTENIRQTIFNGKVFYDATIKEQIEPTRRKPKSLRGTENPTPIRTIREQTESNPTNKPTRKPKSSRRKENPNRNLIKSISIKNRSRKPKNSRRLELYTSNTTIKDNHLTNSTRKSKNVGWIQIPTPNPTIKKQTDSNRLTNFTRNSKNLILIEIPTTNSTIKEQTDSNRFTNFTKNSENVRRIDIPTPNPTIKEQIDPNRFTNFTKILRRLEIPTSNHTVKEQAEFSRFTSFTRNSKNIRWIEMLTTNHTVKELPEFNRLTNFTRNSKNLKSIEIPTPNPTIKELPEFNRLTNFTRNSKNLRSIEIPTPNPTIKELPEFNRFTNFTRNSKNLRSIAIPTPNLTIKEQTDPNRFTNFTKNLRFIEIPTPNSTIREQTHPTRKLKSIELTENPKLKEPTESTSTRKPQKLKTTDVKNPNPIIADQNYSNSPNQLTKNPTNLTESETSILKPPYPNLPYPNPPYPNPLIINNHYGKKRNVRTRNVNPIRRVKRVYKKRYNPDEVRRRLLEKEKSNNHTDNRN